MYLLAAITYFRVRRVRKRLNRKRKNPRILKLKKERVTTPKKLRK